MVRNNMGEARGQEAFDMLLAAIAGRKITCPACKGSGCDRCGSSGEMSVKFKNDEMCKEAIDALMDCAANEGEEYEENERRDRS